MLDDNGQLVTIGFDEKNSIECPIGVSIDGRNNISGVSYLYVAEDEVTACEEIKTTLWVIISLAEFIANDLLQTLKNEFDNRQYL